MGEAESFYKLTGGVDHCHVSIIVRGGSFMKHGFSIHLQGIEYQLHIIRRRGDSALNIVYLLLICNKYAPCIIRKLIIYTHIIWNSTITSAPGHEHG